MEEDSTFANQLEDFQIQEFESFFSVNSKRSKCADENVAAIESTEQGVSDSELDEIPVEDLESSLTVSECILEV